MATRKMYIDGANRPFQKGQLVSDWGGVGIWTAERVVSLCDSCEYGYQLFRRVDSSKLTPEQRETVLLLDDRHLEKVLA